MKKIVALVLLALGQWTCFASENLDSVLSAVGVCAYADTKSGSLFEAVKSNNVAEVQRLISEGANVNAKDYSGQTALIGAAKNNLVYATDILIEAKADVNAKNKDGETALMIALTNNASYYVIRLLKEAGARW